MPYSRMKIAVGVFVVALFLTIFTSLYLLLLEKGTFEKRYKFHFATESAASFTDGMPIKLSGFSIGVIDKITLKDDGTAFMTFSINKKNKKWITKDSVLMIKKPLIGSAHIEIYSAVGNEELREGSTLTMLVSDDINDMVSKLEPVVKKVVNIISSIDVITEKISKDDSDLMKGMKNIEKFTSNLSKNDSLLTTVTGDEKSTQSLIQTLHNIKDATRELQEIGKNINTTTASLDSSILAPTSSAIKEGGAILKDVKNKLETLNGLVNAIGGYDKDVLMLKEQISVGIEKTNQIMDKVDSLMQQNQTPEVKLP